MIDLETLGTEPGCTVLSIGAAKFDPNVLLGNLGEDVGETVSSHFQVNIDRSSSADFGLKEDFNTIKWWGNKPDAWEMATRDPVPLDMAVTDFLGWWQREGLRFPWSHGASFDIPLMEHLIRTAGKHVPWKFWDVRDTRTMFSFDPGVIKEARETGVHHKALDDAIAQAVAVQKIVHQIGRLVIT